MTVLLPTTTGVPGTKQQTPLDSPFKIDQHKTACPVGFWIVLSLAPGISIHTSGRSPYREIHRAIQALPAASSASLSSWETRVRTVVLPNLSRVTLASYCCVRSFHLESTIRQSATVQHIVPGAPGTWRLLNHSVNFPLASGGGAACAEAPTKAANITKAARIAPPIKGPLFPLHCVAEPSTARGPNA